MTDPSRFDLDVLEFRAVRELLTERLTTALGRRAVAELVPFDAADDANTALAEAAELARRLDDADRAPVGGAVEVRSWIGPFFAGEHQVQTRDLADLKRTLRAAARSKEWLARDASQPALCALGQAFPRVADIVGELEETVDDRGEVLTSASVRLAEIRREIDVAESAVRSVVAQFVAPDEVRRCLQSVEPAWRHGRPVFQVRQDMRHKIDGVLHDRSQSGATLFIEPSIVVEAANRLSDARADEHREIQVILTHVCRGLRRCAADIERAVACLEHLDLAMARARLIAEDGFCAVPVVAEGPLRIRRGVHPILLRAAKREDDIVPLDVTLGDPYTLLVITGPNTGGKTVALKTIGLLSAMALAGVPIPAAVGTQVPAFDRIFADIGDEQGISQNLSTFSSHVTRIVRCVVGATGRSLVLLDELGAGTDPEEGGALGYSVLEELERRRVMAVVTTHLGRLKEFAYSHAGAENGAMAFDGKTLAPTFRLDVGIPGASHALDIARRVGVPQELVDRAHELIATRDERLERVIEGVQETRQRAEEERKRTERLSREAESVGARIEAERREIELRKAWLAEEADAVVDDELRAARELLQNALKPFVNAPRPFGEQAKELRAALDRLLEGTSVHRRRMRFLGGVKKDAVVYVPRLGKRCKVKKLDRAREIITIEVGKLRLELPFEDVSWLQPLDP